MLNEGRTPIAQEKGKVQSAVLKVCYVDLWLSRYRRY
jgi:hypothetical protein